MNHLVCFVKFFFCFFLRACVRLVCAERLFMFIYKVAARTKPSNFRFSPVVRGDEVAEGKFLQSVCHLQ